VLDFNGGMTKNHIPNAGSSAINRIPSDNVNDHDQRGILRSSTDDIGAVKYTGDCVGQCRIYRLRHTNGTYFYTANIAERDNIDAQSGWTYEGVAFYGNSTKGYRELNHVYRMRNIITGKYVMTVGVAEYTKLRNGDWREVQNTELYVPNAAGTGRTALKRFYNSSTKNHIYVKFGTAEYTKIKSYKDWREEGTVFYVF
jgi:hypothetical protein